MRHLIATVTILSAISGQALGTSPQPRPPAPKANCLPNPDTWSREHIEKIAIAAIQKRFGHKLEPGQFEAELTRTECDWWVVARLLPRQRGTSYGVMIGANGEVKWVNKIDV